MHETVTWKRTGRDSNSVVFRIASEPSTVKPHRPDMTFIDGAKITKRHNGAGWCAATVQTDKSSAAA